MEITRPPVRVGIVGSEAFTLNECANELNLEGYELKFCPSLKFKEEANNDIFIVGMSEFADANNLASWKSTSHPFLILGIDNLPQDLEILSALNSAVGYIRSAPTLTEILLNLRLGLYWHNERELYSKRISNIETKIESNRIIGIAVGVLMNNYGESEQHVFDSLKTISRNKQRRISSVAEEIITKLNEHNHADIKLNSLSNLQTWLTANITIKQR